jgi:hypothetical protein
MRSLDVDYVLVVFGGAIGYASDDINKFLWMVPARGAASHKSLQSPAHLPEKLVAIKCMSLPIPPAAVEARRTQPAKPPAGAHWRRGLPRDGQRKGLSDG